MSFKSSLKLLYRNKCLILKTLNLQEMNIISSGFNYKNLLEKIGSVKVHTKEFQ
jgi:hypothetical protein